jgi:hypothetical protein
MLHSNQLLLKRLERKVNSISGGGGGALTLDSVDTTHIANGTITTADISDGAITQAKFSSELQLALATFDAKLYNLENPGFWGTFKFKNDNISDGGATLTITAEKRYYNPATETTETQTLLNPAETINKGNSYEISIPIGSRLINKDTIIRMYYTINKAFIEVNNSQIFQEDDKSSNENGDYFDFKFDGTYDENNGGDAEISFNIADNI